MKKKIYLFMGGLTLLVIFPFNLNLIFSLLSSIDFENVSIAVLFLSSLCTFLLCHFSNLLQPIYIFFHELSHALLTLLTQGKIHEIKITKDMGYVKASKDTMVVRLAPYLFSLSTFIVTIGFVIVTILVENGVIETKKFITPMIVDQIFQTLLFISLAMTTYYNIYLLRIESSDFRTDELMFSLLLTTHSFLLTSTLSVVIVLGKSTWIKKLTEITHQ